MKRTTTLFHCHLFFYPDFTRYFFLSGMMLIFHFHADGQQANLTCNTSAAWVNPTFTVVENHSTTGLGCWEGSLACLGLNTPANVINSNTSDFATGYITGVGSLTLSVKDNSNDYDAGDYAGFVVSSGLFSLGLFQSIQIKTYLNGAPKETYQAVDLIGLSAGFLSGPIHIGFTTTMGFDEVEIHIDNLLGLGSYNVYYAELESFCDGDPLVCNVQTRMNAPDYPMTIDYSLTGSSGISVATVDNPLNAISASTTDFASLIHVANLLGSSFFTVEEEDTPYPVGTFVGFDIENTTLVGLGVFNFITITSYLNDMPQQTISGPALIAGAPLLSTSGRYTIGFVTNTMVDKVKITIAQPVNVTVGTTKIYSAIFQAFCEGDDPTCNGNTILTQPDYPVLIDMNETGLTGAACAGCNIFDPGNVIDASSSSFSLITITAGVAAIGSIAVKDQLTDYPAGTFAAFRIENPTLVGANALTGITISTYLNGVLKEAQTNAGTLVSVNTDLIVNDDQQLVGFITTQPFDEIKISLYNVGSVNVGTTKVHEAIVTAFCPTVIECDTTYYLNRPEFPVYIDAFRSGIFGAVCAACAVTGEPNVITASNTDYALITVVAGAASFGSVAVADALYTYPPGTYAGFVIQDLGLLLEAQLFATLTISTYNNGVLQESKTGGDLLDLAVIILFISDEPGRYNVGFKATLPFDEIRISIGSLVSAINLVRVYGAFADTRASNGGDLFCNDAPLAIKDVVSTNEDNAVIIDVLANDVDSDDPLGIPSVTVNPDHGMVTVNADSTITYTPDPDYFGPDDFIYILCDPHGACDTAIVIINVIAVNDPPVANVDYVTTPEDMPVTTTVRANDSDVDNSLGMPSVTTPPAHGMTTVNGDGTITYTPAPNYNGPDSYIYTLCDPQPLCDTAIVRINVTPVNDPPLANTDSASTPEDTPTTIAVLGNDSDVDNPLGAPSVTTPAAHGMTTVNGDGTITYTPDTGYNGPDSFIYTLCDPEPLCDTAIVRINVAVINNPPVANVDYASTPEDTPIAIAVLANDSDVDSPLGPPSVTTAATNGSTMVNGDGTITYTPNLNYNGPDSFIYQICDAQSLCDTAIVHINVSPVNDSPVANVDYVTTPEDMPVTTTVLSNDSDVDNTVGMPAVTTPPAHGMTTVNGDGTITYTPALNYNGPDTYIYTICDPQPLCDTAIVRINVTPVNDAPVANVDYVTTPEDMPVTTTVRANDSDVDNTLGMPAVTTPPAHGMTTVNGDGTITYTPAPNYNGPDSYIYTLCDPQPLCDTAIVRINVSPVNDAPVANVDYVTTPEDMPVTTTVRANDTDIDNALGIPTVTTPPAHGMTTVNGDGTITYTPAPNYNGPDTYIYMLCDLQPLCDTAIVRINVTPVNDAPVANADNAITPEGTPVTTTVLSNDTDVDNTLGTPAVTTPPTHGMTTVNGDGTITYTPDPNYNGPDSYIYTLCDPGPLCDTAIVHINVTLVNSPPVANADNVTTPEDMPVTTTVLSNDSDPDNPLGTPVVTTPPAHGMTTVNGDGTITYTPAPNYNGPDSYIYTLCDPQPLCDTAIVHINVSPVNDAPVANVDYVTTPEDMPVTTTVLANDSDVDNTLGMPTVTTPPAHGMTTVNGDGTITYTPAPNYFGPDTYIYMICDPQPLCDTAIVFINVSPVNDPPVANVDYVTTPEDMPVTTTVRANDTDIDNALGIPTVTTPPAHGMTTVNGDGTITYTPVLNYNGPDTYIYTLCDPAPLCDTAIVRINVTPVNDAPVANVDYVTTPEDMPVTTTVRANDTDVDNTLGMPAVTTPPAHGMTTVNGDGTITYTPDPDYNGPDSYIYTLCDPAPLCDTAIVRINVTPEGVLSIICPDNLVLECGSGNYVTQINTWIASVNATGGCGGNINITSNYDGSSVPPLSCNLSTGLAITFTATDQCGTSATCIRNAYLDDSQSPMLTPGEIEACYNTVAEAVDAAIDATGMSDNCASPGDLVITYALGDGPFCDTLITLTVSDACGNSASTTYQARINCQVIRLKIWLEGPYTSMGDSMQTSMNAQHTLPGQVNPDPFVVDEPAGHPYDVAPWNYNGNTGNNFGDGGGKTPYPADVVDWILVMVRHEGILPANTIWTCAGWVHKNGNVTFPENCPPPAINPNDDYYFVVQHRNHLGILSPSFVNINCGGEVLEWDFRNSDSYKPIFRVGQKVLETGVWGMFDSNGEQVQSLVAINSADRTLWVQWQGYAGYSPGDYNLDAFTDSFDETVWKNNQNRTTGVVFY